MFLFTLVTEDFYYFHEKYSHKSTVNLKDYCKQTCFYHKKEVKKKPLILFYKTLKETFPTLIFLAASQ